MVWLILFLPVMDVTSGTVRLFKLMEKDKGI